LVQSGLTPYESGPLASIDCLRTLLDDDYLVDCKEDERSSYIIISVFQTDLYWKRTCCKYIFSKIILNTVND